MKDYIAAITGFIAALSVLAILIGIIFCFFPLSRKKGLKLILVGVITFIIGFSTCAATFSLNLN